MKPSKPVKSIKTTFFFISLIVILLTGIPQSIYSSHSTAFASSFSNHSRRIRNSNNLWDHFRSDAKLPHNEGNSRITSEMNRYLKNKGALYRVIRRSRTYMYHIYMEAKKRNLPVEIILLPIVESSFDPFAYSYVGAAGLWQLMPGPASGYGINQNWWYDGRRDIYASTRVALDHFANLQKYYQGDFLLALAAYEAGEGTVNKAIKRNRRAGKKTD